MLGSPIGHSLSPALHRAAYAALDLDWTYDAVETDAEGLPALFAGLGPEWRGLSLTMPLKRAVLPLLDSVELVATHVGAANTVVLDGPVRRGSNTDVPGLVAALTERGVGAVRRVLVLGAGATAASAVAAVAQLPRGRGRLPGGPEAGPEVVIAVRDPSRAAGLVQLARRFGLLATVSALEGLDAVDGAAGPTSGAGVDLVVSTVPAGAVGPRLAATVVGLLVPGGAVCDVVYDGWPTPLARTAAAAGAVVVSGADLLVQQALGQVTAFTGREVAVEVLRAALPGSLGEPGDSSAHRTLT